MPLKIATKDCHLRLPKFLLDWKPMDGKRSRGWPQKSWKACEQEDEANFRGVIQPFHEELATFRLITIQTHGN